ncbi:MAG: hypothetical protein AAGA56_19845 [Myxococcota bacterium]
MPGLRESTADGQTQPEDSQLVEWFQISSARRPDPVVYGQLLPPEEVPPEIWERLQFLRDVNEQFQASR